MIDKSITIPMKDWNKLNRLRENLNASVCLLIFCIGALTGMALSIGIAIYNGGGRLWIVP